MKSIDEYKRPVAYLSDEDAKVVSASLNSLLANEFALFTKTLNYHWNITGPRFHSIHTFLEGQYKELLEIMDNVAERIRILGESPISTVKGMSENMNLNERSGEGLSSNEMLADLFKNNLEIQGYIKESLLNERVFENDPASEDFLVSLLQKHEEMSWMLKSHLD